MYRKKDFETINLNIDKIKTDAIVEYKKNYEPTITEQVTVYNSIKKFIITNKRIVYGGVAQNLLIKNKNPKDTFYTEIDGVYYNWPDLADIEFYSPVPLEDIYNLTNYLLNLGFKYIEAKEGVHPETFKIFVNFINYCDITYMPKYIYYNLPTIIIENIVCTNKLFMLIDAYRVITDPLTSYWRLDKSIIRFQKILSYYPFNINLLKNNKEIEFNNIDSESKNSINIETNLSNRIDKLSGINWGAISVLMIIILIALKYGVPFVKDLQINNSSNSSNSNIKLNNKNTPIAKS